MTEEILIVGGGASGMMCACRFAKRGFKVTVLEKSDRVGKKLLATGNGKCNLTNVNIKIEDYNSDEVKWALLRYSPKRVISEFESMGLMTRTDSEGRVYPYCESANAVLNTFLRVMEEYGVNIVTNCVVGGMTNRDGKWTVMSSKGNYVADKVVVATGSDATMGFNSHNITRSQGHKVTPIRYAIGPLLTDSVKGANGVRAKAHATMYINGQEVMGEKGELLFKDNALSGILAFRLSSALARYRSEVNSCKVVIDFFPDKSFEEVADFLHKYCSAASPLQGMLHKAIAQNIFARTPMDRSLIMSRKKAEDIAYTCKNFEVDIKGLSDRLNSQVACGGISLDRIDMITMRSRNTKGLIFVGECLDIDGLCGGGNLHWAWASAMAATEEYDNVK
ncbi:MAG: aminoacetone oxidase family FAD-binding enzyme [Clostridia bacterium]|jgi:predicted Rossmann fold flavoprotein|nr:aminoacetone oxidase family FAD-binding enzyme [Clostridia bacterium]MCI9290540.1 aminoacetone oxidase family FAD-binding enzyme [Clostridia bacterium]